MEKREKIEKIINIMSDFNKEREWSEEYIFLSEVQYKCEKFAIKFDFFDKYGVDLKIRNIFNEESIKIDDEYADIWIRRFNSGDILNSEKQPNNELLMCYMHPTGPYRFGDNYDDELFDMYYEELKKYKYSYIDELNHYIYFTIDEGMKLYKNYKEICEKYQKLYNERLKKAKADELRKQLEELENN